jgi:hypothetical protein
LEYHPKDTDNSLVKMSVRLSSLSLNNIEWGCLYSGAGIIHILNDKDINKLFNKLSSNEKKRLTDNIVLLKCLYKKAKPCFVKPPEEIINPGKYMWDFSSFSKEILPAAQALSILCLCRAAEIHRDTNPDLGTIMLKSGEIYCDFATTYLRNDEGLFVSAEDKTKFINEELNIKLSKSVPKLLDQVLMHEALLMLHSLTSKDNIDCYKSSKSSSYLAEANNLFKYIFSNYNLFLESTSKDISQFISSLVRCCHVQKDTEITVNYQHLVALLCAELESRIKITGEVEKNHSNLETASLITHFRSASALIEGYFETGIEKFKEIALRIFRYLDDLYDYSANLFVLGDYKKIGYSSRDIAEVLKALLLYYKVEENHRIVDMITDFYETAIETSGLIQSVPSFTSKFEGFEDFKISHAPLMTEVEKAPVFLKSFRINNKKASVCTVSTYFSSSYSLYLSYIGLYYFAPVIPIIKTAEEDLIALEEIVNSKNVEENVEETIGAIVEEAVNVVAAENIEE